MVSFKIALRPVLGFSQVLGLYGYAYGETGRLKKWLRLYSIMVVAVCFFGRVRYHVKNNPINFEYDENRVEDLVDLLIPLVVKWISVPVTLGPLYYLVRHPDKLQRVNLRLASFADHLGSNEYSVLATVASVIGVFGSNLLCLASVVFLMGETPASFFRILFMYELFESTITVIVVSQFCVLLGVFLCQFRKLNQLTGETSDLEKCAEIHSELCALVEDVSEVYSLPAFILTLDCAIVAYGTIEVIWMSTKNFYYYCDEGYKTNEDILSLLVFTIGLFSARAVHFWTLCHLGYEISYESDAFSDYLCRAMRSWHYPCYNKKLTAHIAVRPSVEIRVWDLFPVDNTLLSTSFTLGLALFLCYLQFEWQFADDDISFAGCFDEQYLNNRGVYFEAEQLIH